MQTPAKLCEAIRPKMESPRRENLQLSQRARAMVLAMKKVAGRMALMSKGEMIPKAKEV